MERYFAPISALQHLLVCDRQAALIHIERVWMDDAATAHGQVLHRLVDRPGRENRRGVRIVRRVHLVSEKLGLVGRADAVEFRGRGSACRVVPVEYKRGSGAFAGADAVQLAAQAICIEEMSGVVVREGVLYYAKRRKRVLVEMTALLRAQTQECAAMLHALLESGIIPAPRPRALCARCSLQPACLPKQLEDPAAGSRFLARILDEEIR